MTTGIIVAVLFLLVAGNIFWKKISITGARLKFQRIHKVLGILLLVAIILHIILVWSLLKQRPFFMYILGFIMIGCAFVALLSFLFRTRLKKWIWIHRMAAGIMLLGLIVHVAVGISSLNQYKQVISEINIHNVDISNVADGSYIGECDAGYVYAKVEVIVSEGIMTSVKVLEHRTERGKPAERIVNSIMEQQQVNVDTVSGATNSSKVIMKAVQNALEGIK